MAAMLEVIVDLEGRLWERHWIQGRLSDVLRGDNAVRGDDQ